MTFASKLVNSSSYFTKKLFFQGTRWKEKWCLKLTYPPENNPPPTRGRTRDTSQTGYAESGTPVEAMQGNLNCALLPSAFQTKWPKTVHQSQKPFKKIWMIFRILKRKMFTCEEISTASWYLGSSSRAFSWDFISSRILWLSGRELDKTASYWWRTHGTSHLQTPVPSVTISICKQTITVRST